MQRRLSRLALAIPLVLALVGARALTCPRSIRAR